MKKTLFSVLLLVLLIPAYAQTSSTLTAKQQEEIIERIKDKLKDFQYYLSIMADKTLSQQVRQNAHKANMLLFIGSCEPYEVTESTGRIERRNAVQMETSSVNSNYVKRQPMKQYFVNIMNNRMYSNIIIEQADAIRVDNLRKVGEDKYEAVAHICQYFTGYGENGQPKYADKTEKAVKILISHKDNPRINEGEIVCENIFDIKLGDMKVLSTERISGR